MKTNISILRFTLLATLAGLSLHSTETASARPYVVEVDFCDGYVIERGVVRMPVYPPARFEQVAVAPEAGDYQPHLAADYRAGFHAGRQAALCGWRRNYHGAFLASGCRWESYFQEGYSDGYEGRPMRH